MLHSDLHEKVAMVTGAARGIGRAIADQLDRCGATVVRTDIDPDAVEAASQGTSGLGLLLDVTSERSINEAVSRTIDKYGRVDILVNNAGVNSLEHRVTIAQYPLSEWERIVNLDMTGTFLVTQAVSRHMIQQHSGNILNIASVLGVIPARLQCAFVAAKAGVVNLTRSTAIELAPNGILVNCIAPGSIVTEPTRKLFYGEDGKTQPAAERMLAHIPVGRPGNVEEVAAAALFFVSPASSYVTGQVLCVDGGWSAGGFMRDF